MAANRSSNATVPAHGARAVVTNDTTVLPVTRGIYVGVAGSVVVRMADYTTSGNNPADDNVVFLAVPVGILPIQVDKIYTASTATNMVALY